MTDTNDTTPTPVTRRTVLAGLGAVGVGTAVGAGLGTSGFFSDRETVRGTNRAGELDLKLDYRATYTPDANAVEATERLLASGRARALPDSDALLIGEMPALSATGDDVTAGDDGPALAGDEWSAFTRSYDACENPQALPYVDGTAGIAFDLDDVKPYDEGEVTLSVHVCDNPAYLWLRVDDDLDAEMGVGEPEELLPDRPGGELDDYTWVRLWYDVDCSTTPENRETVVYQGSLAGLRELTRDGYALDSARDDPGDCFGPGVACLGLEWYLPSFAVDGSGRRGFTDLPSDVAVPDAADDGVVTLADELAAKGLAVEEFTAINAVQSDAAGVRFDLAAVQCRHNTTNPNPFAAVEGR